MFLVFVLIWSTGDAVSLKTCCNKIYPIRDKKTNHSLGAILAKDMSGHELLSKICNKFLNLNNEKMNNLINKG